MSITFLLDLCRKHVPKMVALCCEDIVNIYVFVKFHFFEKSLIFFTFGWLLGVIWGGLGDLWAPFCGCLEVRKPSAILRWVLRKS